MASQFLNTEDILKGSPLEVNKGNFKGKVVLGTGRSGCLGENMGSSIFYLMVTE